MNAGDDRMEDDVRDGQRRQGRDNNNNNNNNGSGVNAIPDDEPALEGYTRTDLIGQGGKFI